MNQSFEGCKSCPSLPGFLGYPMVPFFQVIETNPTGHFIVVIREVVLFSLKRDDQAEIAEVATEWQIHIQEDTSYPEKYFH